MYDLNCDAAYDILYIGLGDRRNSIGDEENDGLAVMRDKASNEIAGLTVFDFKRKYADNDLPEWPENIRINVESEILPYLIA